MYELYARLSHKHENVNISSLTYMEELPPPNGCVFELSGAPLPLSRRCGSVGPLLAALAAGGLLVQSRTRVALGG